MANRPRTAMFTVGQVLREILHAQSEDENSSINGDESDSDSDHISEMSDHPDIESYHTVHPIPVTPQAKPAGVAGGGQAQAHYGARVYG